MSQTAKTSREAMKAKAKRLASADPHTKVDSSNEMSSEAANSMPKREFLAMDRKIEENSRKIKNREQGSNLASAKLKGMAKIPARKEGGRATRYLTPDNLINRDVRMANDEREGVKHIGGLKHGGKAHKFSGGVGVNPVGAQNKMMGQAAGMMKKGGRAHKLSGGTLQNYLEAARPELAVSKMMGDEEGVRKRSAGIGRSPRQKADAQNAEAESV